MKLRKGSAEAKAYMARIRGMRATNPRKRRKMSASESRQFFDKMPDRMPDFVYKRTSVRFTHGMYAISRGGFHIGWANSAEQARDIIDGLDPMENPAKRAGVRRVSQITKRAPSKRLIARRSKPRVAGYYPNPDPIQHMNCLTHITNQIRGAGSMHNPTMKQAQVSYCQGLIEGAYKCGGIEAKTRAQLLDLLKSML